MARRILALAAHPTPERSTATRPLATRLSKLDGVSVVDLYAEYPLFAIDVRAEQERLRAHDVIVFAHPVYWYSTPAILKEWQDLVLEHGFAYGQGGDALRGKIFFSIASAGAAQGAYAPDGLHERDLRTLFAPLEQTARLCGMVYLPPFALFAAGRVDAAARTTHLTRAEALIAALRDETFDVDAARDLRLLNDARIPEET